MATTEELYARLRALEEARTGLTGLVAGLTAQGEANRDQSQALTDRLDRMTQALQTLEARLWWIAIAAGVGGAGVGGAAASGAGAILGTH